MPRRVRLRKRLPHAPLPMPMPALADDLVYTLGLGEHQAFRAATLVLDLCRFSSIARTLNDTAVVPMLQQVLGGLAAVIERHRGLINKFPGDGVIAFFPETTALPIATENAAAQALHCAKDAMWWFYEEMHYNKAPLPRPTHALELCAGIDYGTITVGLVGTQQQSEFILIGDSVNSAAKCQEVAVGREVVVGHGARTRSGFHADWFDTGPQTRLVHRASRNPYRSFRFQWAALKGQELAQRVPVPVPPRITLRHLRAARRGPRGGAP
jgi:adenylate cyclase